MANVLNFRTLVPFRKRPRRTVQTKIKKQSVQGLHSLLFGQAFCESSPEEKHFI